MKAAMKIERCSQSRCISEIFYDTLDSESAVHAVGINFAGGIFCLHQKRERALVQAFDHEVILHFAIDPRSRAAIF